VIEGRPKSYESQGLTLKFLEWGEPGAPPLIIHHGFLDLGATWTEVASALSDRFRVIAVDARGHGDSEWVGAGGAYYFPDYLLDLYNLIDAECAAETPILVGHSMGGGVTSYFAGTFPDRVRALVMVEGLGPPKQPFDRAPAHVKQFVETTRLRFAERSPSVMNTVEDAAAKLAKHNRGLSDERAVMFARRATRPVANGVVWKWDPLHRARIGTPYVVEHALAIWSQITAPVLSVSGDKSVFWWPGIEERFAPFKTLRHENIVDAGHNIHLDAPDALTRIISDFLQTLTE
jgi:pimeloyl-ACP methyl ester carboxylesterase